MLLIYFKNMSEDQVRLLKNKISREELKKIAEERFGDMVKAVVDIDKELIAIGGELHVDIEQMLLKNESKQESLWGINLYSDIVGENMIEFDSMINIRPRQNNRSRSVEDESIKKRIIEVVKIFVEIT
jgi:hypothetical protein